MLLEHLKALTFLPTRAEPHAYALPTWCMDFHAPLESANPLAVGELKLIFRA